MKSVNIKKNMITAALITLAVTLSQTAMAKSIDDKQASQNDRIQQGINSGELTSKEAWRLKKQQKHIRQKERRFKADGHFTRRERAIIHKDLLRASGRIHKQKHDRQKQGVRRLGLKRYGINKNQNKQARRIAQGVRSGELTWKETAQLSRQQSRINRQERRFRADGSFTRGERARICKRQTRASKNIYRKKNNNRKRY